MKKVILLLAVVLNAAPLLADSTQTNNAFASPADASSYALGMYFGRTLQQRGVDSQHGIDINIDTFARGFKDAQSGGQPLLTPQQMNQMLQDISKTVAANDAKVRAALAAKNLASAEAFFATNKDSPGVVTLTNGLEYRVVTQGAGPVPARTDRVTVTFHSSLLDGTELESTPPGHPAQIPLNARSLPPGLADVLTRMSVGSVWEAWIPANLAYGERGAGTIPPNATLKFNLQLLGITPNVTPPPPQPSAPLSSDIIAVPSAEEQKQGKKPYTLTPDQVRQIQLQMQQTNGAK
ncbi:MAG: FKBP-type peptidyl-prolyl cis-trans isomerase N-terminal domain-containing protein [Limisphaerales bacterium]